MQKTQIQPAPNLGFSFYLQNFALQFMDHDAIRLVDAQRLSLHQEIVLLVIDLENADLIIFMIQCHKMLVVREDADCLRKLSADLAVAIQG